MTFQEQSERWLTGLKERKRDPVSPATIRTYSGLLNNWILPRLAQTEINTFQNNGMRLFVADLLSPAQAPSAKTVDMVVSAVKQIIASAIDDNGDQLFPRVWNEDYIDAPRVDRKDQDTPAATSEMIEKALPQCDLRMGSFYAFGAGTGLRIGEILATRIGDDGIHTGWDWKKKIVYVRTEFYQAIEKGPKTEAGIRETEICDELNCLLVEYAQPTKASIGKLMWSTETGRPMWPTFLYLRSEHRMSKIGFPPGYGFHSLRRYRITKLREFGVPEEIIKFWLGHELGADITDRYSKLVENVEVRKQWAERVGLGFSIPKLEAKPWPMRGRPKKAIIQEGT